MGNPLSTMMDEIRTLIDEKGFSSDEDRIFELIALLHTEIAEATDVYRKGGSYEDMGCELTDALIRLLHLMSVIKQNPDDLYRRIMESNRSRPPRWNTIRGG